MCGSRPAYRATSENPSSVHAAESSVAAPRFRIFSGNWDLVFDGLAIINPGSVATDVRVSQKTPDGEEQSVVLAAGDLAPMGKALFVVGAPNARPFESVAGAYYEIYADQLLAITAIHGNFPGSDFLWVNPTEVENLTIVKVTSDAPEKVDCSDFRNLSDKTSTIRPQPKNGGLINFWNFSLASLKCGSIFWRNNLIHYSTAVPFLPCFYFLYPTSF